MSTADEVAQRVATLKKSRATYQGFMTKTTNWITAHLRGTGLSRLQVELDTLERNFERFSETETTLIEIDPDVDPENPGVRLQEVSDTYADLKAQLVDAIRSRQPATSTPRQVSSDPNVSQNLLDISALLRDSRGRNLPKLNLPSFDGTVPDAFIDFINTFDSMVHDDNSMGAIDKFRYLQSCLKGDARRLIAQIEVTADNYQVAYDLVRDRYEDRALLVQSHVKKLLEIPSAKDDSASAVRRLVDDTKSHIRALLALGDKAALADALLISLTSSKLASSTRLKWEESTDREAPSWDAFEEFLEQRASVLERYKASAPTSNNSSSSNAPRATSKPKSKKTPSFLTSSGETTKCIYCSSSHHLTQYCTDLLALEPNGRFFEVKKLGLCIICLLKGHQAKDCSGKRCEVCKGRHHTVLHFNVDKKVTPPEATGSEPLKSAVGMRAEDSSATSIIGTVVAWLRGEDGTLIPCRALLDSGSTRNFVTKRIVQLLKPRLVPETISVQGIGSIAAQVKHSCRLTLVSKFDDQKNFDLSCLVLPKITGVQPLTEIPVDDWNLPSGLELADPLFMKPQGIDLLIGSGLFWKILLQDQIECGQGQPLLRKTEFGWVVVGPIKGRSECVSMLVSAQDDLPVEPADYEPLDQLVERFWRLERIPDEPKKLSAEEAQCEAFFLKTTRRDTTGRYTVRLPFSKNLQTLGPSYEIALKRFKHQERRLKRDPNLYIQYAAFINEYIALGHCEIVNDFDPNRPHAFIPHHCVLKPQSSSTKLRVVFDASCKYTRGLSLNDILMNGAKLQPDLIHTILKWRTHRFVFTADVTKMYRQVRVHPEDCNAQLIIWRDPSGDDYKILRLNTVTYGTRPGGFLAVRALMQLATDEADDLPLGAKAVREASYVDDLFSGADSLEELSEIREQTRELLSRGGFTLSKFCSNEEAVLSGIPPELREKLLEINGEGVVRTLGVIWNPETDEFQFSYKPQQRSGPLTKNGVLSQLAQMYDPMGLVCPVVTKGKMLFQSICKAKIPWDTELPQEFAQSWEGYISTLPEVKHLKFPRFVFPTGMDQETVELHGFCDASQTGYGACCYLIATHKDNSVSSVLFQSRSRVTPLKKETMDITRLELEAALLLAEMIDDLTKNVLSHLNIQRIYCWTDSSVVYHWIHSDAHEFDVFVRNRIAKIQRLTDNCEWRHCPGEYNPADLISRGATIEKIIDQQLLWCFGPYFLRLPKRQWPKLPIRSSGIEQALPERTGADAIALACVDVGDLTESMLFSVGYNGLRRTFAYVLRFIERCRSTSTRRTRSARGRKVQYEDIVIPSLTEAEKAENRFIKSIQMAAFPSDYAAVQQAKDRLISTQFRPLAPFIDSQGLLRVGGRLTRASIPYDAKHQLLLPSNHRYTRAILFFLHHFRLFHGGVQLMMRAMRERYWPIGCRQAAGDIVHDCTLCFRLRPKLAEQIMGDLPELRVTQHTPFLVTGVDLAGPFSVRHHPYCRYAANYCIAVFICFNTKAVHLEIVPDYSTRAFMNALARFIADRGRVKKMYSDNATNFQGTANRLRALQANLKFGKAEIAAECEKNGVEWSFIPPRSPNFGGLWEASVKIAKGLMHAVLRRTTFTYDEFDTLVRQVAALINSRPITQLSNDPNDLEPLTPGHFIYGGPPSLLPMAIEEVEVDEVKLYHDIQHKLKQYWKRWSTEYFQLLQKRVKWMNRRPNITIGALVLLREDNVPPLRWPIGRVTKTFPDETGAVRVVEVRTSKGEYRRAISNVALIPTPKRDEVEKEEEDKPT